MIWMWFFSGRPMVDDIPLTLWTVLPIRLSGNWDSDVLVHDHTKLNWMCVPMKTTCKKESSSTRPMNEATSLFGVYSVRRLFGLIFMCNVYGVDRSWCSFCRRLVSVCRQCTTIARALCWRYRHHHYSLARCACVILLFYRSAKSLLFTLFQSILLFFFFHFLFDSCAASSNVK